jgi:hypothetical protein
MAIMILDDTLKVEIYFDEPDRTFSDNICLCIVEDCPEDERIFRHGETNIYLTAEQAADLAQALQQAVIVSAASQRQKPGPT